MIDTELANKCVALGVGESTLGDKGPLYRYDDANFSWSFDDTANRFVRDWQVAGVLMEKVKGGFQYWRMDYTTDDLEGGQLVQIPDGHVWVIEPDKESASRQDESLPRAIIEACVEALTAEQGQKP